MDWFTAKQTFCLGNCIYSKTCVKWPLSKDHKLVFNTNYRFMQVKSIAECSKGSILQNFWPSLWYHLGDNCIQNFHLGRYIVGYTVGNLVLWWRASGEVKSDFRTYIRRRYTSPNENFEYGYLYSNALLQSHLNFLRYKPHKAASHPTKCDLINDVKLLPTVYCRIKCRKFLTLSNQKSPYKSKCIRIFI